MFKRSKIKIVAAIMTILVLLWVGTLGVIYASSYFEMREQNRQMLQMHVQGYTPDGRTPPPARPGPEGLGPTPQTPLFRLSTFYTVALDQEGKVLEIKNDQPDLHTDKALEALARQIIAEGKTFGTREDLVFCRAAKGDYTLVAFMDNTVINQRAASLLRNTLIFGGAALALFFILSVFLAKKIVDPLEQSYQKQKQFISDAGHELKTPISVVSANAELLSREVGDNQWLQNIQYENQQMGQLVGQLLDLARTESVPLQRERLDLSRLVSGETLPFESVAYEKGLTLQSEIAEDLRVEGNGPQLRQIVSILLDNAVGHSESGGVVSLRLTKEHSGALLTVSNPGKPISPGEQSRLFERFYRGDPARSGEGHYGLGLAIAKAIATAHHGRLEVRCTEGRVEFSLRLPAIQ